MNIELPFNPEIKIKMPNKIYFFCTACQVNFEGDLSEGGDICPHCGQDPSTTVIPLPNDGDQKVTCQACAVCISLTAFKTLDGVCPCCLKNMLYPKGLKEQSDNALNKMVAAIKKEVPPQAVLGDIPPEKKEKEKQKEKSMDMPPGINMVEVYLGRLEYANFSDFGEIYPVPGSPHPTWVRINPETKRPVEVISAGNHPFRIVYKDG